MSSPTSSGSLSLLSFPYRALRPIEADRTLLKSMGRRPGSALVWNAMACPSRQNVDVVQGRPGGLALVVILPPPEDITDQGRLLTALIDARPQSVLPHHQAPSPSELAQALRRPPEDLAVEITDYLVWRGIEMDRDTRRLVHKIVELSGELRSVSALSRSLYISRRALGRRFLAQGLPVPSHWLHFSRLLRACIRLQNTDDSVLSLGYDLGYPDGFSLSNQMFRLTGYRPTDAREYLGWEWLAEAWLRQEADAGGLSPECTTRLARPAAHPRAVRRLDPLVAEGKRANRARRAAG